MNKKRILIIEDDANIREVLELALASEGYEVSSASNGKDGLSRIASHGKPDLILLDLMMPIMNGWEFVEALKSSKELSTLPVVVVSAFTEKSHQISCNAFLTKPLDLNLLLRAIEEHAL